MALTSISSGPLDVTIEEEGPSSSVPRTWLRLIEELLEESAIPQLGTTPRAFTRGGVLSPPVLITALLVMVSDGRRGGYATVLEDLWEDARRAAIDLGRAVVPTAVSFCLARKRLRPDALRRVLQTLSGRLHTRVLPGPTGRRFFGVDGSRFSTQRSKKLWDFAGRPDRRAGAPQVTASVLFDLYSEHPVDVRIARNRASERKLCVQHMACLKRGDVLVLDRGYPSWDLFRKMLSRGLDFVVRCPSSSTFPGVIAFLASSADDGEIEIEPPVAVRRIKRKRASASSLRLRVVRIRRPDGTDSVIVTSLPCEVLSREEIQEIYRHRWRIEEFYKLLKDKYFGQGQMHSKSPAGVEQEILAQCIYVALMRWIAASPAGEKLPRADAPSETSPVAADAVSPRCNLGGSPSPCSPAQELVASDRPPHAGPDAAAVAGPRGATRKTIHVRDTLHALASILVIVLLGSRDQSDEHVEYLLRRIDRRSCERRPGRHAPRRSHAPHSKWIQRGRRGKVR